MATGETGFADVFYDLVSVQYHSLKAGHDYGQYVRDAENANLDDIAAFFREVMEQDSARASAVTSSWAGSRGPSRAVPLRSNKRTPPYPPLAGSGRCLGRGHRAR
jgi:hypothetical protein